MDYTIQVDWAPAFELTASLAAHFSKHRKILELPTGWDEQVLDRAGAAFGDLAPPPHGTWLDHAIWRCPPSRTGPGFIAWLGDVPIGDLYTLLAPLADGAAFPLPDDLPAVREAWVRILTVWHTAYFQHIDPAILAGLAAEAEIRRARIAAQAPAAAVEEATGGVDFVAPPNISHVLLIPQYHYRPINLYSNWRGFHYPVDALPPAPDAPADALVRLTRALDDRSRLQILRFLAEGERTFTAIVQHSGLAKATIHHHLVLLRAAGLVRSTDRGAGAVSYRLRPSALADLTSYLAEYVGIPPERMNP